MLRSSYRVFLLSLLFFSVFLSQGQVTLTSSNLPIVLLETNGQEIPEEEKVMIEMKVIYHGPGVINHVDDNVYDYDGKAGIEKRGNTSLVYPKASYSFETRDEDGNNLNVPLVDMPEENDWVLYGPFPDKSLVRNVLTYELWRKMGWYAPRTRLCEVLLNGDYIGVYVLTEKIKRDDNRVDIKKLSETDTTGVDLTGGYILEIDRHDAPGWTSLVNPKVHFNYTYPDGGEIHPTQKTYIQEWVHGIETFLADATEGDADSIGDILNLDSFADYLLLNELTKNIDAYRLSTFLYKDKDTQDPRIVAGPVWDYNFGYGNYEHLDFWQTSGYVFDDSTTSYYEHHLFWFRKLYSLPFFRNQVSDRWGELRNSAFHLDTIFSAIDSLALFLDEGQERNFQQWDILGTYIWPNYYYGETYEEEIALLKSWISGRMEWMDTKILDVAEFKPLGEGTRVIVYPQPWKDRLTIRFTDYTPKNSAFRLFDARGILVHEQSDSNIQGNAVTLETQGLHLAPGIYLYQCVLDGEWSASGKLIKE